MPFFSSVWRALKLKILSWSSRARAAPDDVDRNNNDGARAAPDDVDRNNNDGCFVRRQSEICVFSLDTERRCFSIQGVKPYPATYITHVESNKALRIENGRLSLSELQDEDPSFLFRYSMIRAFRSEPCGNGDGTMLVEFTAKCRATGTSPRPPLYVVAENTDNKVLVKCMSRLPPHARTLDGADPRYFVHHCAGQSTERFESLKHPDYFLAVDEKKQRLVLRQLKRDQSDSQFNFLLRTDKREDVSDSFNCSIVICPYKETVLARSDRLEPR